MVEEDQASRLKAAAQWYAELQAPDVDAAVWDGFREWERDGRNAAAFREIEAALHTLDLSSLAASRGGVLRTAKPQVRWLGALAAGVVVVAAGAWVILGAGGTDPRVPDPVVFATAVGERRVIELEDGTTLVLNTASRIEVAYTEQERFVRLTAGQAMFDVEQGQVPFVVEAVGTQIQALGTAFEVYSKPGDVRVTLIEGSVSVEASGEGSGHAIVLQPGERITVSSGVIGTAEQVDLDAVMSWRTGILQFKDVRLGDAVQELNRYSETKIVVEDASLADERFSGSFKVGDQDLFVSALVLFLPVEVRRSDKGNLIVRRSVEDR